MRGIGRARPLALLAAASFVVGGCGERARETPREAPPSVLLVTVDTLRADALPAWGGEAETPAIDALVASGVLFEHATSQANTTGPSLASMMTSLYPPSSGVRRNTQPLADSRRTLAEALGDAGYATGAFVSCSILAEQYGFAQGFSHFDADLDTPYAPDAVERDGRDTVDALAVWLEAGAEGRFFAWLHLFDPHAPYRAHASTDLDERMGTLELLDQLGRHRSRSLVDQALPTIRRLYRDEVEYVDVQIARAVATLERLGRRDDTLVVLAADHGEDLFEHGFHHGHIFGLHQSVVHVPLVFSLPGRLPSGVRVGGVVENVDVAPTVLSIVGAPPLAPAQGRDLTAAMRTGSAGAGRLAWSQREPAPFMPGGDSVAVRGDRWKLVHYAARRSRLYDLVEDPGEARDVAAADPELVAALEARLEAWRRAVEAEGGGDFRVDPESREMLRRLGYSD